MTAETAAVLIQIANARLNAGHKLPPHLEADLMDVLLANGCTGPTAAQRCEAERLLNGGGL